MSGKIPDQIDKFKTLSDFDASEENDPLFLASQLCNSSSKLEEFQKTPKNQQKAQLKQLSEYLQLIHDISDVRTERDSVFALLCVIQELNEELNQESNSSSHASHTNRSSRKTNKKMKTALESKSAQTAQISLTPAFYFCHAGCKLCKKGRKSINPQSMWFSVKIHSPGEVFINNFQMGPRKILFAKTREIVLIHSLNKSKAKLVFYSLAPKTKPQTKHFTNKNLIQKQFCASMFHNLGLHVSECGFMIQNIESQFLVWSDTLEPVLLLKKIEPFTSIQIDTLS